MRTIKFRGKFVNNNGWVYGFFTNLFVEEENREVAEIISQHFEGANMSYPYPSVGTFYSEVIPETVGQFTGTKDNKGVEIYENDIYFEEVELDEGDVREYYICKWINEWSRFVWLHIIGEYYDYQDNGVSNLEKDEVMMNTFGLNTDRMHRAGNIYDNPELLT